MDEESYEWNNSQADQYELFPTGNTNPGLRIEAARFKPTPQNDIKCYQWTMFLASTSPLYVITAIANMVVLFVWNAEPKHHTTTYVFKMLAMTDVLSCLGFLIWRPIDVFSSVYPQWLGPSMLPHPIVNGQKKANVYISLLLALVRLVKVTPGLSAERIFSRAKLRAICAFICAWTTSIGAFSVFLASPPKITCMEYLRRIGDTVTADRLRLTETVMNDHIGFSIPAFLQMVVMMRVLWQVRKYFHERGGLSEELAKTIRRLDYTVFCICAFSFLTHGIFRVVASVMKARSTTWTFELTILHSIISLFQGFNGLINVAFYAIFVPRFRELVRKRMHYMVDFIALDTRSIFPGQTTTVNADPDGPTFTSQVEGDTTRTRKATSGRTFQTTTATEGRSLGTTTVES